MEGSGPTTSRALWFEEAGRCALRTEPLCAARTDQIRVRTLYSGISRGTEATVLAGRVPESEHRRMRGPNQGGCFPFPVKYGYAAVGLVEDGPQSLVGSTVFCLHPHQDRFLIAASDAHPLPPDLPPERAVLAANMETALNIVWDAGILPGDRVAVFGAGVVGLLTAYISSRIVGTDTVVCDTDDARRGTAEGLGVRFAAPDAVADDCDVVINASGSAQALAAALDRAGFEARVVEASWYGDRPAEIPLGGAFHAKRLTIVSSQVGSPPSARRGRWSGPRRLSKALQLLAEDRLDRLVSGETAFDAIAEAYPLIVSSPATLCHRIRYKKG